MARLLNRRRKTQGEEPQVNLTPLIDVVFSILIMFIVIAPLLEMERVELSSANNTEKKASSVKEDGPITIHVQKDNSIWLNKKQVDSGQLALYLKEQKKISPHAKPRVFHDKSAFFGTYQEIKNACQNAGFEEMEVILKPAGT